MQTPLIPSLLFFGVIGASSAALAQFQDFQGYTGFDVGLTSQVRFPSEFQFADLDADGHEDLVFVSQSAAYPRLGVMLNQGDDTFALPSFQVLLAGAVDLATLDIDADGDLDVAVAEGGGTLANGQTVAIFKNSGTGALSLKQRVTVAKGPAGIAAGDFDADGDVDLGVAIYGVAASGASLRVLTNSGTGTYALGPSISLSKAPYGVRSGDLNGDGKADLVVVHDNDILDVLISTGASFAAPIVFDVKATTTLGAHLFPCVALADLDHDGDLDIAFSDNNHQKQNPLLVGIVTVITNQGGGSFAIGNDIVLRPYQSGFTDLAFEDLNGDSWLDVLGCDHFDWDYVLADGQGGFHAPTTPSFGLIAADEPTAVGALDVDHDGDLDAFVLGSHSNAMTIHRFENGQPFAPPTTVGPDGDLDFGDLDGDGDLDIVGGGGGPIWVTMNQGGGHFGPATNFPSSAFNGPTAVKLADLNNDGRPDLLIGTLSGFNTKLNNGNGTFGALTQWNMPICGGNDLDAVDLDNDGNLDIVIPESAGCPGVPFPRVFIAKGLGNGTFVPPIQFNATFLVEKMTHADLDGDGNQDLVLSGNTTLEIYRGNGNLTFQPKVQVPADFAPHGIVVADLNGDSILDLASCNWGNIDDDGIDETMTVSLGIDGLTYAPKTIYAANGSWDLGSVLGISAADADRDGDVDLFVTNFDSHDVSLFKNRGDGTFLAATRIGGVKDLTDSVVADFTGDGIVDIVLTGSSWAPSVAPGITLLEGLGNDPWIALGTGSKGTLGVPHLDGDGALVAGNTITFHLAKARPNATGVYIVGFSTLMMPYLGSTLVPTPNLLLPLGVDATGAASLEAALPPTIAVGSSFDVVAQCWILDPLAANAYAAASNGILAHSP